MTASFGALSSRVSAWERVNVLAMPTEPAGLRYGENLNCIAEIGHFLSTERGRAFVREVTRPERGAERRQKRRDDRYQRQRALWPLLPIGMRKCHRTRFRHSQVDVQVDESGRASLLGLVSCNRRTCEFCGPRLLSRDAELVEAGVTHHGYGRTVMVTLTTRHWRGLQLKPLRRGLVKSFGALQRHRQFKDLLAPHGGKVFVRVVEVPYGDNGWHPHYHVLLFFDVEVAELPRGELARIESTIARLWRVCVERTMGQAYRPTLRSGVKLTPCHRADYLTKLGLEVTNAAQSKEGKQKGVTLWKLTRRWIASGKDESDRDAALIREFIEDLRGAVVVAWPRTGAYRRKNVAALCPEKVPVPRESAAIHVEEWDALRDRTVDGRDARGAILRAAESAAVGGVQQAVDAVIARILCSSIPRRHPQPRYLL
jgi:hypothetical protein